MKSTSHTVLKLLLKHDTTNRKQDSGLMTENNYAYCFLLSILKAQKSQWAPSVQRSRIQTGQRTDKRKRQMKYMSDRFILIFSSCICLILCNKEKVNSIVGREGDRKQDKKKTVCESFSGG